jgi:hypothetical protein
MEASNVALLLNELSATVEDALVYYLEFFCGNCLNLMACTHCKPNNNFFVMKR